MENAKTDKQDKNTNIAIHMLLKSLSSIQDAFFVSLNFLILRLKTQTFIFEIIE